MYDCISSVEQKKIFGEMCLSVFFSPYNRSQNLWLPKFFKK